MLPDTFPWWGLLALTTAAFTDVVTDLLPAGLLPQMSTALHVPEVAGRAESASHQPAVRESGAHREFPPYGEADRQRQPQQPAPHMAMGARRLACDRGVYGRGGVAADFARRHDR